jgi:tetratricopeptide (TPR) repeat protein
LPAVPGYELLEVLGRGGMGVVYKARQLSLKRVVALKMILAQEYAGAEELARFRTEAEAVARLSHPNIVQIYEVGAHDGRPFLALECLDGGSLARILGGRPLPPADAARLVAVLAGAVQAAHQRGVIHRDLKPANILLTAECAEERRGGLHPKIADFGLAKQLDSDAGHTQTGQVVGTPAYMAPEQASGRMREVGPAADIYALGAILYETLIGRPPFQGANVVETLEQVRGHEPVAVRQLQPNVPRDLETVCHKCLEKDPSKRYACAQELADDLGRFLAQQPIRARPPNPLDRALKFTRRHRVPVTAAASVFTALLLALILTAAARARAVEAEQEARRRLLESYADAAQLAVRKGDWRAALDNYDRALREGHPDTVGLRLGRAKALFAVNETARATAELEALSGRADLWERRGTLLLLQGDLLLGRDNAKAQALVRQALEQPLSPAEAAYARGLLAETSPEAVEHFRKALELDRSTHGAHGMLGLLLILMGRVDEAEKVVVVAEAFFPEDPNFKVAHAIIQAQRGDLPGARAWVERARGQLSSTEVAALQNGLASLAQRRDVSALLGTGAAAGAPDLSQFPAQLSGVLSVLSGGGAKGRSAGVHLRMTPATADALLRLAELSVARLAGLSSDDGALDELREILKIHPEGTLHYLRACLLLGKQRFAEAEAAFLTSAETPSFFATRQPAVYGAVACEAILATGKFGPADAAAPRRAVQNIRKMLQLAPVRADQAEILVRTALLAGDHDLARSLVADWERLAPDDLRPRRLRAQVEFLTGAYALALKAADQVLARKADDAEARFYRTRALDELRKLVKAAGETR